MLALGATSPIGSSEAKRAALGIRKLKTPYESTMGDNRKSNLILMYLHQISNIDIKSVTQMFTRRYP